MVAMDDQLQSVLEAVERRSDQAWTDQVLVHHDLLQTEPTDPSMINDHFREQAPLYTLAISQFNENPSVKTFNDVVQSCTNCHLGTCPGPLERIAKRRAVQP